MEQVPNTSVAVEVKRSVRSLRQMFEPQGIKARPPVKSKPMWLNKGTNDSTTINGSPPSSMSQNAVRETGSRPETVSRYRTQETGNCSGEGDEPERHSLGDTNGRRKDTSDRLVGTSGRLEDKSDRIEGTSDRLEDTYDTIEGTSGRLEDTSDTIQGTSGRLEDTSDTIEGTSGRLKDTSDRLEDTSDRLEGTSGNDKIKSLLRLVSRRRRQRPQHFLSDSSVQPLPSVPRDGADGRHTYPAGPEGVRDTSRQKAHSEQPNRDLKSVRMGPCVKQMTQAFNQQCLSYNSPSPSDRLKRNVPTPPGPTNSVARNKETASCYPCTDNSSDWPAGPGNNIATNEDAVGKNTILLPSLNYLKPLPDSQGDIANRNETEETNFGSLPQQDVKEFSSEDEDGWDDSWDEASGNSSDENDVTVYNVEEEHQNSNSTDITWHEESDQYDDLYENIAEFRQIVSQSVAAPSKTSAAVPLRSSSEYMASDTNPTPFMGRSLSLPTIQTKHRVSFSDNECYSDAPDTDDDSVDDATPWQCTTLREWMGSGHKLRWSEMPRVKHSGVLKTLTPADIKLQEAMFEILSSEAVYINRLDILISVFYASKEFSAFHSSRAVISEEEREDLFPDIIDIWDISREFLSALEKIWDSDVLLNGSICDVITDFAVEKFQCYENYMIKKRQQDKKMDELSTQPRFVEALRGMHSDPKCKMLSLGAYLLEPFQRFMRYPLLLKEVLGYMSDKKEKQRVEKARETIESMISNCNQTVDILKELEIPWQCTMLREWMGSGHKLRWSEMPRVKHSGVLKTLSPADINLQEAMFEILSSEAVYINRLDILISVFYESKEFSAFHSPRAVISEEEREDLFPDIIDIWDISREFLSALEKIWDSDVLLNSSICDVITDFAVEKFQCYENYMIKKRQQDKKMDELSTQPRFVEALRGMHSDPKCKMLSLGAYLLEPFQRFMRYPLLLKEVLGYMSDKKEKQRVEKARETIESMISNCNQMVDILKEQEIFDELVSKFVYKNNLEKFDFASEHRWLVKKSIAQHILPDSPPEKVQLFLFNDVLFMTRLESAHRYEVMNYCPRIALETGAVSGPVPHPGLEPDSLWILVLLDGQSQHDISHVIQGQHDISHVMAAENPSEAEQWREHLRPEIQEEFQITYKDWYPYMVSLKKTTSCSLVPQVVFSEGEKVRVVSVTNNDELYLVERPCDGTEGWISRVDCAPVMDEVGKVDKLRKCYRRMDSYGSLPSLSP